MKHIIVLIDTSYSMQNRIKDVVKGLNKFVERLKEHGNNMDNTDIYLTVVMFSDKHHYICKAVASQELKPFKSKQFNKFGCTSVYDTITAILDEWMSHINIKHSMYIITDGDDNHSCVNKEYTVKKCKEATATGNWEIVHCHTDVSKLSKAVKSVVYDVDNLEGLLNGFSI